MVETVLVVLSVVSIGLTYLFKRPVVCVAPNPVQQEVISDGQAK